MSTALTTELNILIGCESSGVVREAFRALGHNATSCDLLPCDDGSTDHIQGDVMDAIRSRPRWDLIILHPPCTAICASGNRHYGYGMAKYDQRIAAIKWTLELYKLAKNRSEHVAMENPVGSLSTMGGIKASCYVQPYEHGHPESKKTGFWLHNLPNIQPTNNVKAEFDRLPKHLAHRIHFMGPSPDRWKQRSKTFSGLAQAMAQQWSTFIELWST